MDSVKFWDVATPLIEQQEAGERVRRARLNNAQWGAVRLFESVASPELPLLASQGVTWCARSTEMSETNDMGTRTWVEHRIELYKDGLEPLVLPHTIEQISRGIHSGTRWHVDKLFYRGKNEPYAKNFILLVAKWLRP